MSPARERCARALLLVDVINPLEFDGGEALLRTALPAARCIARLKAALRAEAVPAIYVNDNFGCWDLGFRDLVALHARTANRGRPIIELLAPQSGDHFVLKPMHSGFYGTSLELLLQHLGTRRLIITGFAADICVLFTANDAYMRDYDVAVPIDCVASERDEATHNALRLLQRAVRADTRPSTELADLNAGLGERSPADVPPRRDPDRAPAPERGDPPPNPQDAQRDPTPRPTPPRH